MLYQVATGLLSADEISGPLRSIFSHQKNVDVLLDEVTGINSDQRIVHLTRGELLYDFLILATGIQYNYFGHDEWRHFAPGLESLDDADVIRGKILRAFERAEEIVVGGQRIQAGTVLWGAGVVASPAGRWLEVETDRSGKIIVGPDLSVPGHTEVFGIGDTHMSLLQFEICWASNLKLR